MCQLWPENGGSAHRTAPQVLLQRLQDAGDPETQGGRGRAGDGDAAGAVESEASISGAVSATRPRGGASGDAHAVTGGGGPNTVGVWPRLGGQGNPGDAQGDR